LCQLCCMGARLGLSLWGMNIDWGFLRTECWGRYLDLKGRKTDHRENFIMMNFTACILHRILLGWLNQGGWGGRDMWHAWGRGEVFTGFWLGGPVRDHWEVLGVGGRITLRLTLGRFGWMGRTGFGWLRIESSGGICEHGNEPSGSIRKDFFISWVTISFSNNILHHGVSEWVSK
jgi:hypothetical protein